MNPTPEPRPIVPTWLAAFVVFGIPVIGAFVYTTRPTYGAAIVGFSVGAVVAFLYMAGKVGPRR